MKIIQTKKLDIKGYFTLNKNNGGCAFPLDIDWCYNDYFGKSLSINIYILCFQISIYYEF
jgi:hypothetical protein